MYDPRELQLFNQEMRLVEIGQVTMTKLKFSQEQFAKIKQECRTCRFLARNLHPIQYFDSPIGQIIHTETITLGVVKKQLRH